MAWQRDSVGLARLPHLRGLALDPAASPAAHLVYQATADQPIRLWDVAIPLNGRAQLRALLAALQREHPERPLRLLNEPEESTVAAALDDLGWDEPARQEEMARALG